MSIPSLQIKELAARPPTIDDDVSAAVEALSLITSFDDRAEVEESVRRDFQSVQESGVDGEVYIQVPQSIASLHAVVRALDEGNFRDKFPKTGFADETWRPELYSNADNSRYYTKQEIEELGSLGVDWPAHARIAVHNASPERRHDPLLHFEGLYYSMQLKKLAEATEDFEAVHPDFNMVPLNANAFAFIALMRRIQGKQMPVYREGYILDASLPEKINSLDEKWIGAMYTEHSYTTPEDKRLRFGNGPTTGFGCLGGSIGLSVGKIEA